MDVPTVLKEVLGLTGMTQADLARKIEVSQGTISKWLSEQQSPNKRQWDQFVDIVTKDKRTKHLVAARAAVETVPVVGYVGAGAETEFFGEQGRYGGLRARRRHPQHRGGRGARRKTSGRCSTAGSSSTTTCTARWRPISSSSAWGPASRTAASW